MAARRFKSKVDRWIVVLIVLVIIMQIVAIGSAALQASDPLGTTAMILTMIAVVALLVWLLTGTHYTVDGNTLRVVAGPFRWKVPVDQITSVEATRTWLSSPALSLDRMRIRYGNKRVIVISPADKTGFLKAIDHEFPT